jgi:hypothetical protein
MSATSVCEEDLFYANDCEGDFLKEEVVRQDRLWELTSTVQPPLPSVPALPFHVHLSVFALRECVEETDSMH